MYKRLIMILVLLILVSGCNMIGERELTDSQRQEIAEAVRQRTREIGESGKDINKESVKKILDFYVDSDNVSWMNNPALIVNNSTVIPTKEKYQELMGPQIDQLIGYSQEIEIGHDYVAVLSKDIATHVFEVSTLTMNPEGKQIMKETGIATIIYVLENDVWKVLQQHVFFEKIDL